MDLAWKCERKQISLRESNPSSVEGFDKAVAASLAGLRTDEDSEATDQSHSRLETGLSFESTMSLDSLTKAKRPRILFNVSGVGPLDAKAGGAIERLVISLAERLAAGWRVTLFGDISPLPAGVREIRYSRRYNLLPRYRSGALRALPSLVSVVFRLLRIRADVVVSTNPVTYLPSYLYAALRRRPVIAWELDHVNWTPPWNPEKTYVQRLVSRADRILVPSTKQLQRMSRVGVDQTKIAVVPCWIDTNKYKPALHKSKKQTILYVAKFTERKKQLTLLQIFRQLTQKYSNLSMTFVGAKSGAFTSSSSEPGAYYHRCMQFAEQHNLATNLYVFEKLEETALIKLYQESLLFVFPSSAEGFGLAVLEAMACGLPCIVNSVEPVTEIVDDCGIVVDTENVDLVAREIERLLSQPQEREELSRRSRERAVRVFDVDVVTASIERELLEGVEACR